MKLRVARHTSDLEKIKSFYIHVLGFELLGSFKDHDLYDGVFIGIPNLDWHLEFTKSTEKATHQFDQDDILVLYPETNINYNQLIKRLLESNTLFITSKKPYWNKNGEMFLDPDGYRIVISSLKIEKMNITIETERLILRELLESDDEAMFVLDKNPNVHEFLGKQPVTTIQESRQYIQSIRKQYVENGIGRYAVILKETNEFIGWCGIKYIKEPENGQVNFYEIGYRFIEDYWGKGFGYESAKAWLEYGFNTMNIQTMYASANIENTGLRRILEKIGMQLKNEFAWNEIPCVWYELDNKMI